MPKRKRILVIEDDPYEADLIQQLIGRCIPDAKVSVVNEEEAVLTYIISSTPPLLILLDLCLPSQDDGIELIARLRAYFKIYQEVPIPIVVLTHSTNDDAKIACLQLGANAYMNKPGSYQGWKDLCALLKTYWFDTVTLPRLHR